MSQLLEVEDNEIKTFHMDLLSNVRKSGPGHIHNLDLRLSKQKVIFGEFVRSFVERLSVGLVNVRVTCVIWDYLLIRNNKSTDDMYMFLAYVTAFVKQDLLGCSNVLEFERKLRERAAVIDDYDFYTVIFNAHRTNPPNEEELFEFKLAEKVQANFPALESVVQDRLRERSAEEAKVAERKKKEEEERSR